MPVGPPEHLMLLRKAIYFLAKTPSFQLEVGCASYSCNLMTKGGNEIFHNFEKQLIVKKVKIKLATKTVRAMVTLSHYRCFQYFV